MSPAQSLDRSLPHSLESERAVLGSVLVSEDAIQRVNGLLTSADFFNESHRVIYAAMLRLSDQQRALDLVTVMDELKRGDAIRKVGGASYLSSLVDTIPDSTRVESYAQVVKEKAQLRRVIRFGNEAVRMAMDSEPIDRVTQILAEGAESLDSLDGTRAVLDTGEIATRVRALYQSGGLARGKSTGWPSLDERYTIAAGAWTLITGMPGHGKSEFLDELMLNVAQLHSWQILMFSAESYPPEAHVASMTSKLARQPFNTGPTARMSAEQLGHGLDFIGQHFRFINPAEESLTLDRILATATQLARLKPVNVLSIDPWNEVHHPRASEMSETEYISVSLTKIRRWARAHGAHVFVVAHPVKMPKDRETGRYGVPTPYDVAGSAHWRNKADYALAVYREMQEGDGPDVEIHVQKVRRREIGSVGVVKFKYDKVTGSYHDPKQPRQPRLAMSA